MADPPAVIFEELPVASGKKIAVATLNNPKALNALNLQMIEKLQLQLMSWQQDGDVVCIFLQGAGDRAFCAGGDVVSLYHHAAGYGEQLSNNFGLSFFSAEYRLDYQIHTMTKPVLVWGSGIVMGGGLGLLYGASHRIVTETTRMAMPECSIGLYPDVGASWFLTRMPGASGRFLALTGLSVNAADSQYLGLADTFISNNQKNVLMEALEGLDWTTDNGANGILLTTMLKGMERHCVASQPVGSISPRQQWIDRNATGELADVLADIGSYAGDDRWCVAAANAVKRNCPVSMCLVDEQLQRSVDLSLPDVFRQELIMSVNCMKQGHFKEGVRAQLIDRDQYPRWQPDSIEAVDIEQVRSHFTAPWQGSHPLADLR